MSVRTILPLKLQYITELSYKYLYQIHVVIIEENEPQKP